MVFGQQFVHFISADAVVDAASLACAAPFTMTLAPGSVWNAAAAGTFESELSDVTRRYAGKGVVRYAW